MATKNSSTKRPRWRAPAPVPELSRDAAPESFEKVASYLERFGYLAQGAHHNAETLAVGLKLLQKSANLPQTGLYDDRVRLVMNTPRCGVDNPVSRLKNAVRVRKWNYMPLTYKFDSFCEELTPDACKQAFSWAMGQWGAVSQINFTEKLDPGDAKVDIRIRWARGDHGDGTPFDGVGGVIAHSYYPPPYEGDYAGDIHLDEDETWDQEMVQVVALHQLGHSLGLEHSQNPASVMAVTFDRNKKELHGEDIARIQSLYGIRDPVWGELADFAVAIAASGNILFQLQRNGCIYKKTGAMSHRGWQLIDDDPKNVQIATTSGQLFARRQDGSIYRNTGTPLEMERIDNKPGSVEIVAADNQLYLRHQYHNEIWAYTGSPGNWQHIDSNNDVVQIAVAGGKVYKLHKNGDVFVYTGTPFTGWERLDASKRATAQLVAGSDQLYKLMRDGDIWHYTGKVDDWERIDNNPNTKGIVATGRFLFAVHRGGGIWRWLGNDLGWKRLLGDSNTAQIAGLEDGSVLQLRGDGQIAWAPNHS